MNIVPMKDFMPEYLYYNDKVVIEKIIKEYKYSEKKALFEYIFSLTYKMTTDIKKAMWDIGSLDIYEMWKSEKETGNPLNVYFIRGELNE